MDPAAETIRYRSFPLRDDWPRSLALPVVVLAIALGVGLTFGDPGWGAFALAVLGISTARYFLPTGYVLDADGVRARFLGRERARRWREVRALYRHRDGVHLSPFPSPSPLDPFRGLYVRFAGNGEEVLAFCERHVPPVPAAPPG